MSNKKTCCLCGKKFEGGSGNDPYPLMSSSKECCDDCNSRYVLSLREIYFPNTYSDRNVLFNHTPTTGDLMRLLRAINFVKEGCSWFTATLANAERERAAAKKSLEDHDNSEKLK